MTLMENLGFYSSAPEMDLNNTIRIKKIRRPEKKTRNILRHRLRILKTRIGRGSNYKVGYRHTDANIDRNFGKSRLDSVLGSLDSRDILKKRFTRNISKLPATGLLV